MRVIPLTQGKVALVDDEDYERFGHFKWHALKSRRGNFYAARHVNNNGRRKYVYLHGEILGILGVDHKSGDGLDCQRENLRPATSEQNNQAFMRKRLGASSRFRGVRQDKRTLRWQVRIHLKDETYYLGYFDKEEDAARAYDSKAKELGFFKEALNFPNE